MAINKHNKDDEPTLTQAFVHAGSPTPWCGAQPPALYGAQRPSAVSPVGGGRAYVDDHIAMYKAGNGEYFSYYSEH